MWQFLVFLFVFCCWFFFWFFFLSNHWGSHIPSSWMVHAGCVFVAGIHPSSKISPSPLSVFLLFVGLQPIFCFLFPRSFYEFQSLILFVVCWYFNLIASQLFFLWQHHPPLSISPAPSPTHPSPPAPPFCFSPSIALFTYPLSLYALVSMSVCVLIVISNSFIIYIVYTCAQT